MIDREGTCRACEGTGMLADDEGWQYGCSVCHGSGFIQNTMTAQKEVRVLDVDHNNRLLD
ncbi:hypothetical protein [Sporosarcina sp. Te-1]|uniref:hypothetical protein n=1 Tax=Sporosarcina sp. Te-1 TaxID=2818390 RepID=UPI001A9D63E7|nr:hypothetical protein [Sporosarcina sp. Te-1]QTD40416.1 hypothetical protein J3U78_16810 [Sporosarcina sp. Te-1]